MNILSFLRILILGCIIFLFFNCKSSKEDGSADRTSVSADSLKNNFITIIHDSVKIFSKPGSDQVVLKLNSGAQCILIAKGNFGVHEKFDDYWYYIDHQGIKGWVFGSNTSLRLKNEFEIFLKTFINPVKDTLSATYVSKFLDGKKGFIPLEYKRLDNSRFAALLYKKNGKNDVEILLMIYKYGLPVNDYILFKDNIGDCAPPQVFFTSKDFIKLVGTSCRNSVESVLYYQILGNNSIKELKSTIIAANVGELLPKIKAELKVINKSMMDECKCIVQSNVKLGYDGKKFIFYSITRDECTDFCLTSNSSLIAMTDSSGWSIRFEEKGIFHQIFECGLPNQYIVVLKETRLTHLYEKIEIDRIFLLDVANQTMQELNLRSESCTIVSPEQFGCHFCFDNTSHQEELIFIGNPLEQVVKKVKIIKYDETEACKMVNQESYSYSFKWSKDKKSFEKQ